MLANLQLRDFRCFESLQIEFGRGFNFFVARNGQGKTSILEAACVLLRLQSQRNFTLAPIIRIGTKSCALSGRLDEEHLLEFQYSLIRRRIAFDQIEQRTLDEYLRLGRVVSFANTDITLVRGGSEMRRRYLDFLGAQIDPIYRPMLRRYERALRARNSLLKSARSNLRELAAYDGPLLEYGTKLSAMRARLVEQLAPFASTAHHDISGIAENLSIQFLPGNSTDFANDLAVSRKEEARLRQTIVGPHRDDIRVLVDGMAANQYASEGQQRTAALALKIAQARVFMLEDAKPPLLLIDDIFGELDPIRRNLLLQHLPIDSQKFVTATTMQWHEQSMEGVVYELLDGRVCRAS